MKKIAALGLIILLSMRTWAIPAESHQIMIAGPTPYAVEVGRRVAKMGGNVVDVSVAIGLALSVTSPYYAALGGGGFALVRMNKGVEALDFREMAPSAYGKDSFTKLPKGSSENGGHAIGVPGFPAGLMALHERYGKLKWSQLFAPALELARNGFLLSGEWVKETSEEKERFQAAGLKYFFKAKGESYKPGEIFRQPELARALGNLRDQKLKGFYAGPVARDIVQAVEKAQGQMTLQDLANYRVRWLKPLETDYAGYHFYLMPPPSSGGIVLKTALALVERLELRNLAALSVDELHLLAEIEARSYRGRLLLGDPDFHKNPIQPLTSAQAIEKLAGSIKTSRAVDLPPLKEESFSSESKETTHFSVMDTKGNAVALTVTLNGGYGSGVVSEKYGIALNNEMDDFTTIPNEPNMYGLIQGQGNLVEAGKRPLSSMSPTLIEKDGQIVMAIGAPGGPRIISGVLQVIYRALGRGQDLDRAIQSPRVHHQFRPNTVFVDREMISPEVIRGLKDRGHKVEEGWMGKVYAVRRKTNGLLEGAFDSRGEGAAGGY